MQSKACPEIFSAATATVVGAKEKAIENDLSQASLNQVIEQHMSFLFGKETCMRLLALAIILLFFTRPNLTLVAS